MSYTYHFDKKYPVVFIDVSGFDVYEDHVERIEKITGDREWSKGHNVYMYIAEDTKFSLSKNEILKLAFRHHSKNDILGNGKMVIVTKNDFIYGLSRMWEVYASAESPMEIMVFRDRSSANRWLDLPPEYFTEQ